MLLKIKLLNNITNLLQYTFKHNVTKNSIKCGFLMYTALSNYNICGNNRRSYQWNVMH